MTGGTGRCDGFCYIMDVVQRGTKCAGSQGSQDQLNRSDLVAPFKLWSWFEPRKDGAVRWSKSQQGNRDGV